MLKLISNAILRLAGWKTDFQDPGVDKYVLVGAPHTTNWDFPLALLGLAGMGIHARWAAKHTLFWWPLGVLFRAIGGIPVDRTTGTSFLKHVIALYRKRSSFVLAIAPEGTRSISRYWKTGFYTIAVKAEVPIVLGYVDYAKKTIGIGKVLHPSGNIEHDFEFVREFYRDKQGKYPDKHGAVRIKGRKNI